MTEQEKKAYNSGAAARRRGKARINPYHCATARQAKKYWAWFQGYDEQGRVAAKVFAE